MMKATAHITGLQGLRLRVTSQGNLQDTIAVIQRATRDSVPQVADLAHKLQGKTLAESARNIYDFITGQIAYKLDRRGSEEIRTAARSWADRASGVDCEDYSIFVAALALNMGYVPGFEIVDLNQDPNMDHIFAVIYPNGKPDPSRFDGYVVDPTPHPVTQRPVPFNQRPNGIKRTMSLQVEYLSGVGYDDDLIMGLAGMAPAKKATKSLMKHQRKLLIRSRQGISKRAIAPELRKTRYAIMLNGTPEQETVMDLWPAIKDINKRGELIWKPGVNLKDVADYIRIKEASERAGNPNLTLRQLRGLGYLSDGELSGLFKKLAQKARQVTKNIASKVRNSVKKVGSTIKKVAPKVANVVNKINPVAVGGRVAFLAAVRNNFQGIAENLRWGYLSESEARQRGFDMSEWKKVKAAQGKTERTFFTFGGSREALKRAVMDGAKKSGVSGLGAIPAAILTVLQPIINLLKRVNFGKLVGRVRGAVQRVTNRSTTSPGTSSKRSRKSAGRASQGFASAMDQQRAKEIMTSSPATGAPAMVSDGSGQKMSLNPMVIAAGIAVIAGILFFVL